MARRKNGFTLIEILISIAILAVIASVFVTVLISSVDLQTQQSSQSQVQQQGQFLEQKIQYFVGNARLIDLPLDAATGTLVLREPLTSISSDPTTLSLATGTVFVQQGTGAAQAITSGKVAVSNLSFTRHYNLNATSSPFGTDSVTYSFTISAVSGAPSTESFRSSASVSEPVPQVALVQQAKTENNGTGFTALSAAYPSANESGDLLIAVLAYENSQTPTLSDSNGNSWSLVGSTTYANVSGAIDIFAAANAKSGSNTVSTTWGGSVQYGSLSIYEYRGAATSSPLDVWSAQSQPDSASPASPAVTPTSSVELVFGVDSYSYAVSTVPSAGLGYTLETSSTANNTTQVYVEDGNQYITGNVAAPWSLSNAATTSAMIATFIAKNFPSSASSSGLSVNVLVIGAGGGGTAGKSGVVYGFGGGGGVMVSSSTPITSGTPYSVVVGTGGAGLAYTAPTASSSANGGSSSFGSISAAGGTGTGQDGPYGGDSGSYIGGATSTGYGGGGGAGCGGNGSTINAGIGATSSISGTAVGYCGGGASYGGSSSGSYSDGGGGPGNGTHNGTANTGGGGSGGNSTANGGSGGSGVVIISAPASDNITASGGTYTTSSGNDIWTFTASGTWTPTF